MKRPASLVIAATVVCLLAAVLAASWTNSRHRDDRIEAAQALALKLAAGDTNAITALKALGEGAVPELLGLVEYRDPFWRRKAWEIVPKLPSKLSRPLLFKVGPVKAGRIRVAGCKALGSMGPLAESAIPTLLATLQDSQSYIANEAAAALSKIGPRSVTGLIAALSSKHAGARHAAAYGLGEMGPQAEAAIPALISKLDDKDSEVRTSSAASLMLIGFPMVGAISKIVDQGDADARDAALNEFLRFYGSLRGMIPPLAKMAHDSHPASRRLAVQVLGAMRATDDEAIKALRAACRDQSLEVRMAALSALNLVCWRASEAVPDIVDCLEDPSPELRQAAVRLLRVIGPPARAALPALKRCVQENQGSLRAMAQDAIQRICPPTQ